MEHSYVLLELLGEGAYGCVWKAVDSDSGEIVAVKQLKPKSRMNLLEVTALSDLVGHPNIVQLKDVARQDNGLYSFVFEYMEGDLMQTIVKRTEPSSIELIKSWMSQILQAVAHTHNKGYIHRDLKPENILVAGDTLKLADFGLAKKMCSYCDLIQTWTHVQWDKAHCWCGLSNDCVGTRWYKAPELLLQSPTYSSAIDMWSVGVIMATLFRPQPIFRGRNKVDQLYQISSVLGAPSCETWPEGVKLATKRNFQFPKSHSSPECSWAQRIPVATPEALDLIQNLCTWNPQKRLTAVQALQHPFFRSELQYFPYVWPKGVKLSPPYDIRGPCIGPTEHLVDHACNQVM